MRNDTAIEQRQFEKPLLSGLLVVSALFLTTWQSQTSIANHKPAHVKAAFYQMGTASWYGPASTAARPPAGKSSTRTS